MTTASGEPGGAHRLRRPHLLFQRDGQGGLQVLPGAEMKGQEWTPVTPSDDAITCNIGDMLMRWSDDKLPSNFHRVRPPREGESLDARQSIAFFAQANTDVLIESPGQIPSVDGGRVPGAATQGQQRVRWSPRAWMVTLTLRDPRSFVASASGIKMVCGLSIGVGSASGIKMVGAFS